MALAHKRLYESKNLAKLQVADYLGSVVDDLVRTYSATGTFITVEKDIQDAAFSLDTAIPLGMLLTELVSNCMKHAFVNQLRGTVSVSLKPVEKGRFKLVVSDDGRGMPTYSPGDRPASMGLDLVDSFVRQLDATLDITVGSGTTVSLVFDPRMGRIPDV
jgi:two-component sensor histidine kinase